MARAQTLHYMAGITRDAGDHFEFHGVPRRDLDADDIARLDDATYATITGTPPFAAGSPYSGPLYAETQPAAPDKPVKTDKPSTTD